MQQILLPPAALFCTSCTFYWLHCQNVWTTSASVVVISVLHLHLHHPVHCVPLFTFNLSVCAHILLNKHSTQLLDLRFSPFPPSQPFPRPPVAPPHNNYHRSGGFCIAEYSCKQPTRLERSCALLVNSFSCAGVVVYQCNTFHHSSTPSPVHQAPHTF